VPHPDKTHADTATIVADRQTQNRLIVRSSFLASLGKRLAERGETVSDSLEIARQ
jgi:hypothetical protein